MGNLLENAARHGRPGGPVAVSTGVEGGEAVLRVSNDGPRLSPHIVARLAEPFERGGRFGGGGAGLGLSIVRSVAEAHGGRLHLAARPAGGLTATVALPGT